MSIGSKIGKLKSIIVRGNGGCGCRAKKAIRDDIIEPKPISKLKSSDHPNIIINNLSSSDHHHHPCPKIQDSLAVVKDSDDPYEDFRQSMVQMILEKEMYSRVDLQQLLDCFLHLNSPQYHHLIVRAFIQIWNGQGDHAPPSTSSSITN